MESSPPAERRRLHRALFHGAWIILLLVAGYRRFAIPLTPLADNDTWGFLNPGLQALLGHGFQHTNNRNFLYPGLIYGLLAIFKDFRAITLVQHLLGLATGALLLATWCSARRCLARRHLPVWIYDAGGLMVMATYLFATEPAHFEYFIRPDVVCPFFATLALFSLVRFLLARKVERNSRGAFFFGMASLFLAILIPTLKPSFWLTSAFFTIPVWIAVFDAKEPGSRRALMAGLPLLAGVLLLWLPEKHFAARDGSNERFVPESSFSIHALIIREQLADDVAHPDPAIPYPPEKLRSTLQLLDAGIAASLAASPHHFESLGYDADYLLYHDPFFTEMARAEGFNWSAVLPFYRYYYWRTWRKRPAAMLHKITRQLGLFYNLECPAYCDKKFRLERYYTRSLFILSDPLLRKTLHRWPPAVQWLEDQERLKGAATLINMPQMLRKSINGLGNAYLPGLITFLLALPGVVLVPRRRARFGLVFAVLAIGYSFNFGNNLGIAILHTLEVSRYTYVQFATTLWTELLTFIVLVELAIEIAAGVFRGVLALRAIARDAAPMTEPRRSSAIPEDRV